MARRMRLPFLPSAAIASLAAAIGSLALPSGPTYDPYAWLIWGRDLAHLDLVTTGGGTSWKPLPAIIDAMLSPLDGGAADGWVVVARAGALFAVVMAARLAWRIAPRGTRALAAAVAGATLLLTHEYLKRNGVADAEGLMVAFGLLAVDRHLDGHRTQALGLIVAAGLIRVEAWPFALVYAAWLAWRSRRLRTVAGAALGLLVLPLMWFGGDWLGSGRLTTAADRARHAVPGSPGAAAHPFQATLVEAWQMLPPPAWIAIAVALVAAVAGATRARRAVVLLAATAGAWILIVAAMAARGYAGLPRFLFMADGLAAVVAGVGAGYAVAAARAGVPGRALPRIATAAAGLAVLAAFAFGSAPDARLLPADARSIDRVADMDARIAHAIDEAGGASAILRCGMPVARWYTVTAVAYDLHVAPSHVHTKQHAPAARPRHCPSQD